MSSFARLLGASPSVFSITFELRLPSTTKHDLHRTKAMTIVWKDDEVLGEACCTGCCAVNHALDCAENWINGCFGLGVVGYKD